MAEKEIPRQSGRGLRSGQAYFVTICSWNAVAPGALFNYTNSLRELEWKIKTRKKHQQYDRILKELEIDYSQTRRRYFNAFDRLLAKNTDRTIDLNDLEISKKYHRGHHLLGSFAYRKLRLVYHAQPCALGFQLVSNETSKGCLIAYHRKNSMTEFLLQYLYNVSVSAIPLQLFHYYLTYISPFLGFYQQD